VIRRFGHDQNGSVLVEASIVIPMILLLTLGAVDFLFIFYQWNAATKAVEIGARIAAVSDPVAPGLRNISISIVDGVTVKFGDPIPDFQVTCDGSTQLCSCTRGSCPGMGNFSWAAMNKIICGRDSTSTAECDYSTKCNDTTGYYFSGMCGIFRRITAANVKIVYTQTGLGYSGRDGGPVPTIIVSVQNLPFQFFFLNGLLGFQPINIPALTTTTTGEVLSSAAQ